MKEHAGHLTARQKLFCQHYVGAGKHCAALAARLAGYAPGCSHVTGCQLLQKPKIAATVQALEAALARDIGISRKEVIAELVGAAELARELREPGAMINAWKQVATLSGYYRPEEMRTPVQRPDTAAMKAKFEAMSDEELIALSEGTA
jgi:phage terminase small subunit